MTPAAPWTGPPTQAGAGRLAGPIYLDYNATTPVDPRVLDALLPYLTTFFGNPSSSHHYGSAPAAALDLARTRLAALIGAQPGEVVFTGSGSEANSLAIRGAVLAALTTDPSRWMLRRPHVVTQVTEHPAVLRACQALQRLHDIDVTYLPVDPGGRVDPAAVAAAMTDRTVLVTVMYANNETGVLQPIADLAAIAHHAGALIHTDAAQTVAKIPVDVTSLDVDLLTVVGHKMYAPKGIAALYVREGTRLEPMTPGGDQEGGLRAGTENVAFAVALGRAAQLAQQELDDGSPQRLAELRDTLHRQLQAALPGRVHLNGDPDQRLPNTLNISIEATSGEHLLATATALAASTGSACHSGTTEPSPVLTAMRIPRERALAAVRLSVGRWTTGENVEAAARLLAAAAEAGAS